MCKKPQLNRPEWFWLMPAPLTLNTYNIQKSKAAARQAKAMANIPPSCRFVRPPSKAGIGRLVEEGGAQGSMCTRRRRPGGTARREAPPQRLKVGRGGPRAIVPPCCSRSAQGWGVTTSAGRAGQEVGKGCAWFESRHKFEVRAAPRERRAVDVLEVVRQLLVDRLRSGQDNQPAKSET